MDFIFKVDPIRRNIKVPDGFTVLTMDHNVHKLVFVCPYYEDFAFDSASIVFMIDAPDGKQYIIPAEDYESFPNSPAPYVKFTLTLKSYITSVVGYMSFCITADIISSGNVIEKSWHSKNVSISIGGHIDNDDSEDIPEEDVPTINQRLNNLDSKVGRLQTTVNGMANGSPTPVETKAEMTEETAVYLYVGDEEGESTGYWYSYDSTEEDFVPRGEYGGAVTDTTLTMGGRPADSKVTGELIAETTEDLQNSIDVVVDTETVTTWESYDKDSEELTQIPGYINSGGGMSGTTSSLHKTWYFTADEDMDVYATRTNVAGQLRIGIYNNTQIVAGNIIHYGATNAAGTMPTEENPFHVEAGECVVVSHYNPSEYDFVLHYSVTNTNRVFRQTLGLTEQMGIEVDEKIVGSAPDVSNQIKSKIADASALSTDALLYEAQLPSYYTTPEANPASFDEAYSYMERRIRAIPDVSKSFVFIADTHWTGNTKHSTQMINYIRKRTGIRKVLFGGDIKGNATNKYLFVRDGGDYLFESRQAFGTDYIPCVGDHDHNTVNVAHDAEHFVPYMEVHEMFMGDVKRIYHCYDPVEKLAEFTTDPYQTLECLAFFHTVYYVDDVERNIRFIVLNCGNAGNYGAMYDVFGDTGTPLMRLQFDFLAETLMDTPAGMNVCVLSHKGAFSSVASYIFQRILSAFKAKKNWTNPESSAQNETIDTWWPNRTNYNFTEAPDIGILFTLQGHVHYDNLFWSGYDSEGTYSRGNAYNGETLDQTKGQIPHIFTSCDAYMNRDSAAPAMELGTITEQCFDIVSVSDGHIHLTRFGAGSDRDVYVTVE